MKPERLEAFSDSVFAVALTVLVLKMPALVLKPDYKSNNTKPIAYRATAISCIALAPGMRPPKAGRAMRNCVMIEAEQALAVYFEAYKESRIEDILDWFLFPCHFVSDADAVALMPLPDREAARPGVERVVKWHRMLGVTHRRIVRQTCMELSPRISCIDAVVDLEDDAGNKFYDFEGLYTFVRNGASWRVAAITHNQIPRLLACIRARGLQL